MYSYMKDAITNKHMFDKTFDHYVRVAVNMDLIQPLKSKVLIERQGFAFFGELSHVNLPDYCSHCMTLGHHINFCMGWRLNWCLFWML